MKKQRLGFVKVASVAAILSAPITASADFVEITDPDAIPDKWTQTFDLFSPGTVSSDTDSQTAS